MDTNPRIPIWPRVTFVPSNGEVNGGFIPQSPIHLVAVSPSPKISNIWDTCVNLISLPEKVRSFLGGFFWMAKPPTL